MIAELDPTPEDFSPPTIRAYPGRGIGDDDAEYIRQTWDGEYNDTAGVTGLYLDEPNLTLVANRSRIHHDSLFHMAATDADFDVIEPHDQQTKPLHVVPFASVIIEGNRSYIDLPESGGGLSEAVVDTRVDGVVQVQGGSGIETPEYLFEVAWVAHLLGHPENAEVSYDAQPQRRVSADPNYYKNYTVDMRTLLNELSFAGYEPPDPIVERDL